MHVYMCVSLMCVLAESPSLRPPTHRTPTGHLQVVQVLLAAGVKVNGMDKRMGTALMAAAG